MTFPALHRQIVSDLLAGRFVLEHSPVYQALEANKSFYASFFSESFGYKLTSEMGYYFLTSEETGEESSRDLLLFLSLLAYEYHHLQQDLVQLIVNERFDVAQLKKMITQSSKYDALLKGTQAEDLSRFLNYWNNRHLISFTDKTRKQFFFNAPINSFLEVAVDLSKQHLDATDISPLS